MKKGKRRRDLAAPEPLEDVLARAGEDRFAKKRAPIPVTEWRAAVGGRIADRAKPTSLERGVLVVTVATSVWATELQMLAPELVLRLKQRGYAVDSLRFRVGVLEPVQRPPERRKARKVPPPADLTPDLRAQVDRIDDDGLRAAVEQAASANLAWQSHVAAPAKGDGVSGAQRGARAPRDAGRGTAPPGRTAGGSGAASPRSSASERDRRR